MFDPARKRILPLFILLVLALTTAAQAEVSLQEMTSIADVAELVTPSVVNIFTTRTVRQGADNPLENDPFFRRFFNTPQPREREATNLGSGVVMSRDGFIITNNHVVAQADEIRVSLSDGRDLVAEIVGTDEASDLALIRVDANDLTPLEFGDSDVLRVGEVVLAVGNPFGVGSTVTMGIVSAKGRTGVGLVSYEDYIQTDAAINPGNSGGALVNLKGQLVGINSAILSRSGGSQGIGFAIPTAMAEVVLSNLRDHGRMVRGYLGVTLQEVDGDLARSMGLDDSKPAVLINQVVDGSAAEDAGLRRGDVVTGMNGEDLISMPAFRTAVGNTPPGTQIEMDIVRDGRDKKVKVTLAERPGEQQLAQGNQPETPEASVLEGLRLRDADARLARQLNLPRDTEGPVVVDVESRTPAARAGLAVGDIILEIDREEVASVRDVQRLVDRHQEDAADRPVLILVQRGNATVFVAVTPPSS